MNNFVERLNELIYQYGPNYIEKHPYEVYQEFRKNNRKKVYLAYGFFILLESNVFGKVKNIKDVKKVSTIIKDECFLNEKVADELSEIVVEFFSNDNIKKIKSKQKQGFNNCLNKNHKIKWEGYSSINHDYYFIGCVYKATIVIRPNGNLKNNKEMKHLLNINPYISDGKIFSFFERKLDTYLNKCYERYHEQVDANDFDLKTCVKRWCNKNDFKLISCQGEETVDNPEDAFYLF